MAQIFVLDITQNKDILTSLLKSISKERKKASENILSASTTLSENMREKKENAALLKIGSEVLLSYALKKALPLEIKRQKGGKPYLENSPHFSISHSGNLVVCAISQNIIGVDIEKQRVVNPNLSSKIYSPSENPSSDTNELLKNWVLKESYVKMTGEGLKRSFNTITIKDFALKDKSAYFHFEKILNDSYFLSVCTNEKEAHKINFVLPQQLKSYFNI